MIRRAVFWSFSTQIVNFTIQFGSSIVMARLLSPQELGVYAVAIAIMGIVQLFGAFGVGTYVIREKDLTPETLDTAYTINAIISCALALLIFLASFVGGLFLGDKAVDHVLRLLALTPLLAILAFRPNIMLQRAMHMRGISLVGTLGVFVTAAVTIITASQGASSLSPAYGSLAGSAIVTLGTFAVGHQHMRFAVSLRGWKPITGFGLRLMSIGGISNAAIRVSDIILGHFLGLAALGLYARASNLSNILFTNVYGSATRVVFAKLSEAQRKDDRVTEVYFHGYRVIVALMAPLLLGLAVLAGPVVHILYGDRWLGAAIPLSLLLLGQLIALTFAMNWELFVLRDDLKTQTRLEITRSVIGLVTLSIGSMFSLVIVAATCIVDNLLSYALYQPHMPRLARAAPSAFYRAYGEAGLLAVAAALPSLLLMIWYQWAPSTPLPTIAAAVAMGACLWLLLVIVGDHPILREIDMVLAKLTNERLRLRQAR